MPATLKSDSVKPSASNVSVADVAAGRPAPSAGAVLALSGEPLDASTLYAQVYRLPPHQRIALIKGGVPAHHVDKLAQRMSIPKELLINTLRLSRATVNRKARAREALAQDESERVLGVEYLIGQVENMVAESGDPAGFDAAAWLSAWLHSPLPALDCKTPASYMDTIEGQKMVSGLLATAQSGAYA